MKKGLGSSRGIAKWWALSALILIGLEIIVCVVLFLPQTKALADVEKRRPDFDKQQTELTQLTSVLQSLRKQTDEIDARLQSAKLYTYERPEVAIVKAVGEANSSNLMFFSLTPVASGDPAKPVDPKAPPSTHGWVVRAKGRFPDLVVFLNKLEQQGLLLDSTNFQADGITRRGIVEVCAAVRICTPADWQTPAVAAQPAATGAATAPATATN